MAQAFWIDETGAVISAEIALILTILALGVIVGLSEIATAVNNELNDVSNAIGRLDQSYATTVYCTWSGPKLLNIVQGSVYRDQSDDGDLNLSCDLVGGLHMNSATEGGVMMNPQDRPAAN